MSTALRTLDDDDLVRVCGGHPLIRHLLPHRLPTQPGWSYGQAVAVASNYWEAEDGGDIMMVGPADDAAELARLLLPQGRSLSMPTAAYDLLGADVLTDVSPWSFRWADSPNGTAHDAAAWTEDRTAVDQLLDEAYPDASVRPRSARARAWAGIHDADGRLIACAADTSEAPGVGFVAAIATRPELRAAAASAA